MAKYYAQNKMELLTVFKGFRRYPEVLRIEKQDFLQVCVSVSSIHGMCEQHSLDESDLCDNYSLINGIYYHNCHIYWCSSLLKYT